MANMMKNQPLSNESKLRIVALKARINGSHQAEGHELTKLNVLLKGSDWKTKTKLTDAESLFDTYDKVIQGLQRFEKIGFIGKLKLKRGLPLSASLFQLIKG
ncbi:anti-termination [Escherichia phage AV115]|nr:anti-termination [Escherichia phage AV115]